MSIFLIIILCIVYNVWYNNYKDKQKRGIQLNLEKMKMEARKRMKILGIHEPTIAQFIEEGKISFSGKSYLGANYWINEERKKAIEIIEKENNILVYYAIEQKYMGDITMLYLFYISPYEEDWEMDYQSIVENYQYTYGLNEIETKFNPEIATRGGMTTIASVKDIPKTILVNSQMYLSKITEQSTKLWILLFFILVIFFVLSTVLNAKVSPVKSFLYAVLFLFLGSILSYGVFLIFPEKLLLISPRYGYGFSFFVVSIIMLTLANTSKNVLGYVSKTAVCLFCVYLLSFTFVYASALSHQKESFERQSMILADDLKDLVNRDTVTVHSTSLFKDSPVFVNSSKNYPILKELVPPNEALYWPNQFLFRTYTGLNVNMEIFDINALNKEESELMKSNYYHDIYVKDSEVFVHVK